MEWILGLGCIAVLLIFPIALVIAFLVARRTGQQRNLLDAVNLDALTEGERVQWTAYRGQLETGVCLNAQQQAQVISWTRRRM